jgi:CO dehydrogenase/acetyl-CoA synthase alpha subunit
MKSSRSLLQACGGVNIKFPKDKSDTVVIRGPADDVAKARHMLNELVAELAETSHTDTVSIPSAMHRHIIGRSGANIKKVKDGMSQCARRSF